jgi:iron(III) transport system permease protein
MTVAVPASETLAKPPFRLDLLRPAFYALAALLAVLVVLPLAWLAYYSVVDKEGQLTIANFAALASDATLRRPFLVAIGMALGVGALSCAIATPLAWLVSRTDLPGRRLVRALVTASFVTPPFLGAIAWEILAAPNSGLLNVWWRAATGAEQYDALFNIYTFTGLVFAIACYTFPYVFTLVANGLDRVPSDLEDASSILGAKAWTTLRRVTIPLVLPAMLAGSMIAILQALTMFGSPASRRLPPAST